MTFSQILAIYLMIAAVCMWINEQFLRLPFVIGLTVLSLGFSGILIGGELAGIPFGHTDFLRLLTRRDFQTFLLDYGLGFLLFAGALRLTGRGFKEDRGLLFLFSGMATVLAIGIYAILFYGLMRGIYHWEIGWVDAWLFGAVLAPLDPIAVLSTLKKKGISIKVETMLEGESIFSYGFAYMVFLLLVTIKQAPDTIGRSKMFWILGEEMMGGVILGWLAGLILVFLLRRIHEDISAIFASLASVVFVVSSAGTLGASGLLALVVMGIVVAFNGHALDLLYDSHSLLHVFWGLADRLLNGFLMMLVGVQVVFAGFFEHLWLESLLVLAIVMAGRYLSVALPARLYIKRKSLACKPGAVSRLLTWAGPRGGLAIGLALQLPEGPYVHGMQIMCLTAVVLSVAVQGLMIGRFVSTDDFQANKKRISS